MKYIVEVNAKYLTSIEAESPLSAEHEILNENDGCWGALAFDDRMMKTDTFKGAVQTCEMIGYKELQEMATDLTKKSIALGDANEEVKTQEAEIEELKKKLEELGIGRPSTYAPTISTLTKGRGYIVKGDKTGVKCQVTNLILKNGAIKSASKTETVGTDSSWRQVANPVVFDVVYEGEIVGELDPKNTTVQELGLYMAGAQRNS